MRTFQARSSCSERALPSDSIGARWRDLLQPVDRLAAHPLGGRVGSDQVGVLGLQAAQLVQERVVDLVADLGVVEDVVAMVVVLELATQVLGPGAGVALAHSSSCAAGASRRARS